MKLKKEFILRKIAEDYILVPNGETIKEFNGLITLNDLGAFIWSKIPLVESEDELLNCILGEYEVERSVAEADLGEFLEVLKNAEII